MKKGYTQVYTGNGKGKTTGAFGLALLAICAGKKVIVLQFMKGKVYIELKELEVLPNLKLNNMGVNHLSYLNQIKKISKKLAWEYL